MHNYYYDDAPGPGPLCEAAPPRARRHGGTAGWKALAVFGVFLFVILTLTGVLLVLSGGASLEALSALPSPALPGGDGVISLPISSPPSTTMERAEVGSGVTLSLSQAQGEPLSLQALYQKCLPSIAGIRSYRSAGGASGTGVIMSGDGYIITNYHVIQGAERVEVVLPDDDVLDARLVGGDQTNDLAVLKVEADGLTPAEFGDSNQLQVGDSAYAIGNPLGEELRGTLTDGIISAINRDVNSDGNTMTLIQTSAAINPGNSGGALLNAYGQVVGITNMKMTSYYGTIEGLGFAIPSTTVKAVVDELIAYGFIGNRPTLGITGYSLTTEMAEEYGLVPGVYIESVESKSDAWAQGMRPGDVVTACNGKRVYSVDDINEIKAGHRAGDVLSFRVYRDGETLDMDVKLVERYELDQ